ncbi:hypothetical protein IWX49DRAFT_634436 [Phyllosticta citricarpa]
MSDFQKKVTIAREEIKRIGVHQIMDDDLMPRAAATGWKVRKRPLINEPDTRPQQVSEWSPEFLFALQELLRRCESVDEVKSLLRRQVHRRQSDATLKLTVRLARDLLLIDLTRVLMHLVAPSEATSERREPTLPPRITTTTTTPLSRSSPRRFRFATAEESGEAPVLQNTTTLQHKDKREPWVWDMLFKDLKRLKEIELATENFVDEAVEDEPTKLVGYLFALKKMGKSLDELDLRDQEAFGCACLENRVWEMHVQRSALAHHRAMVATRAAKICAHLEKHAGLVLAEHLKWRFTSVLP